MGAMTIILVKREPLARIVTRRVARAELSIAHAGYTYVRI